MGLWLFCLFSAERMIVCVHTIMCISDSGLHIPVCMSLRFEKTLIARHV